MQKYHSIDNFNPIQGSGLKGGARRKDPGEMDAGHHIDQDIQMLEASGLRAMTSGGHGSTQRSQHSKTSTTIAAREGAHHSKSRSPTDAADTMGNQGAWPGPEPDGSC